MWGVVEALRKPVIAAQAHSTLNPSEPLAQRLNTTARVAASAAASIGPTTTFAPRQSGKLLLNNILNHVTRRGPFLGNSAGVLAMTYNIINAYISFPPRVPVSQSSPTVKVPLNTDLNGFLAFTFRRVLICRTLDAWTPLEQPVTPLLSGFLAGAIFRSTKGPKAMVVAGSLVMGVAAAWQGVKRNL